MTQRAAAGTDESLIRGYGGRVFLSVALGVIVINLGRHALPPLLPAITADLAITSAAAGLGFTLMRVWYALFQYPSGRVADVASRILAIQVGLIVLVGGFFLLVVTGSYAVFLVSMSLIGAGAAWFFVSERILLSDLFVHKRGRAFGFMSAASQFGSILAAGLAVVVLALWSLEVAFVPVLVLLVALLIGFHWITHEQYDPGALGAFTSRQGALRETATRVFATSEIRLLVLAYTLIIFVWEGVLAFLPTYLAVTKDFPFAVASGGFAALFAVGIVVQPLAGSLSDRFDRRLVGVCATVSSMVGLGVLVYSTAPLPILVGIVLYAAGLMAFTPAMQAHLLDVFPEASKGGDLGAFKTIYEGLSSVGPTYVGVVAGVAGFTVAFGSLLVCLVASAILIGWLWVRSALKPSG